MRFYPSKVRFSRLFDWMIENSKKTYYKIFWKIHTTVNKPIEGKPTAKLKTFYCKYKHLAMKKIDIFKNKIEQGKLSKLSHWWNVEYQIKTMWECVWHKSMLWRRKRNGIWCLLFTASLSILCLSVWCTHSYEWIKYWTSFVSHQDSSIDLLLSEYNYRPIYYTHTHTFINVQC